MLKQSRNYIAESSDWRT